MLKLYAADGEITIKDFIFDLSSVGGLNKKLCYLDQHFVEKFLYITVSFATENLPILVYVAGFVASKVMSKLNCSNCKKFCYQEKNIISAEIDSSLNEYFNNLNRGGLTYPSSILLHTFQASHSIFNTCISSNLEEEFLNLINQKTVLLDLNSNFWKFSNCLQINSMCPIPHVAKNNPIF